MCAWSKTEHVQHQFCVSYFACTAATWEGVHDAIRSLLTQQFEPHGPKAGRGRRPHELERMLRIDSLQRWFNLSGPAAGEKTYDSESPHRFAKVELDDDKIPDESTILRFRHLLEKHKACEQAG